MVNVTTITWGVLILVVLVIIWFLFVYRRKKSPTHYGVPLTTGRPILHVRDGKNDGTYQVVSGVQIGDDKYLVQLSDGRTVTIFKWQLFPLNPFQALLRTTGRDEWVYDAAVAKDDYFEERRKRAEQDSGVIRKLHEEKQRLEEEAVLARENQEQRTDEDLKKLEILTEKSMPKMPRKRT